MEVDPATANCQREIGPSRDADATVGALGRSNTFPRTSPDFGSAAIHRKKME